MKYELSSDIEKVAQKVIKEHFPELQNKSIVCISQEKKDDKTGQSVAQMRKGKPVFADVKIIGGLNAFLISGEDSTDMDGPAPVPVLLVSKHAWNIFKPEQRKALVHQQLMRLDFNLDTGKPGIVDFDVKEFSQIAKLYGAWNDDLSIFFKTANQHPLFEDLPVEDAQPAASKAKVIKANGNGKEAANGKAEESQKEPVAAADASNLRSLKDEVAQRRGGSRKPHAGN